ncbi:MAG TPA: hypothetical protein EYG89_04520 [Bacteroidia bacterium]|nr:hypothetical protein [Bacteroidia bacterium]
MIKILLSIALLSSTLFSIEDYGIQGKLYKIKEISLNKEIKDAVKDFKLSKKDIQDKVVSEVKKQAYGKSKLPYVDKVSIKESENYQILQQDIINPLGRIYKRKGEKVLMKTFQPLDLCFVDGTNMEMLLNQIMYFDRVSEKNAGGDCTYMVSGRSVLELNKRFFPRRFYPARDSYEKRFFITSIPTYVHIENDRRKVYSFPIQMFKNEIKFKKEKEDEENNKHNFN